MNINYYDLYYTVIENRKEIVDDHYEKDYNNFKDFVTPYHKPCKTTLR